MKAQRRRRADRPHFGRYRVERDGRVVLRVFAYSRTAAELIARKILGVTVIYEDRLGVFLEEAYP